MLYCYCDSLPLPRCGRLFVYVDTSLGSHAIFTRDKKFCEELIAHFYFASNWVFDTKIWETVVLVLLMGGIYEMRRWDGLRWQYIYIHVKFHKDWFGHSKVVRGREVISPQTHGQQVDPINLHFFRNKASRVKSLSCRPKYEFQHTFHVHILTPTRVTAEVFEKM
jgi:hypothetical protein